MDVAVDRKAVDDGTFGVLGRKVNHELLLGKIILVNSRVSLIDKPFQILILFDILFHFLLLFW